MGNNQLSKSFGVAMWALFAVLVGAYTHATSSHEKQERAFGYGPPGSNGNGGFGPFGGGNGNGNGNGFGPGFGNNGFPDFLGMDLQTAIHYRTIHGILAALAMVVLFPIGSIFMRVIPGRFAIWFHAFTQIAGFIIYVAAAALGIYLVRNIQLPFGGGNLLSNNNTKFHPIVGLVTLATLVIQPLLGLIHHSKFKRLGRRTLWSHAHIWNGRIGVSVGIVNGGLGLQLANAGWNIKVAYIVVAAIMWFLWMVTAVIGEIRRRRAPVVQESKTVRGARTPKVSTTGRETGSRGSRGSGRSGRSESVHERH